MLTAFLSGLFAVIGIYFTSIFQEDQIKLSKRIDIRTTSYLAFLKKINSENSSVVAKIQYVGLLVNQSITDGEIQEVEDFLADLPSQINTEILVDLNQEFNLLRISGSTQVRKIVDDLFYVLLKRIDHIDFSNYSPEVEKTYITFHPYPNHISPKMLSADAKEFLAFVVGLPVSNKESSYIDLKVSDDERFSIVLAAKLLEELLLTIRNELESL
ncbi:MAG TPA: hypothetical protein DD706_08855 [Nitrospiraceae bacterium]|nr:hypothetical protein [Nitrospiraceae bacterium]